MYLYQIGYGTYENSGSVELSHTRKIGKREFNNMFVEATLELLLNRRELGSMGPYWNLDCEEGEYHPLWIEKHKTGDYLIYTDGKKISLKKWLERISRKQYTRFERCLSEVADVMVELYGFKRVKYERSAWVDGWGDIVNKDRNFGEDDVLLCRIEKKFWKRKKK